MRGQRSNWRFGLARDLPRNTFQAGLPDPSWSCFSGPLHCVSFCDIPASQSLRHASIFPGFWAPSRNFWTHGVDRRALRRIYFLDLRRVWAVSFGDLRICQDLKKGQHQAGMPASSFHVQLKDGRRSGPLIYIVYIMISS